MGDGSGMIRLSADSKDGLAIIFSFSVRVSCLIWRSTCIASVLLPKIFQDCAMPIGLKLRVYLQRAEPSMCAR